MKLRTVVRVINPRALVNATTLRRVGRAINPHALMRATRVHTLWVAALLAPAAPALAASTLAPPWDGTLCETAITQVERASRVPPNLLHAIGIVETGRLEPRTTRVTPWPWSIDVNGQGRRVNNKEAAIAAVQALQAGGTQSIDVGCMQVNLR